MTEPQSEPKAPEVDRIFDWKDPLTRFGVYVSGGWTVAAIIALWAFADWSERPAPNEWGDLAAGFAAPLAFLWLVLGFFQQGKELRLSSKALMLQVDELRNTVAHQAALVEVSREQVAAQLRQEEAERQERRMALQPKLILSQRGGSSGGGGVIYNMVLENAGAAATNVHITFDAAHTGSDPVFPTVGHGEKQKFTLSCKSHLQEPLKALIRYQDLEGVPGDTTYIGYPKGGSIVFHLQGTGVFG